LFVVSIVGIIFPNARIVKHYLGFIFHFLSIEVL